MDFFALASRRWRLRCPSGCPAAARGAHATRHSHGSHAWVMAALAPTPLARTPDRRRLQYCNVTVPATAP